MNLISFGKSENPPRPSPPISQQDDQVPDMKVSKSRVVLLQSYLHQCSVSLTPESMKFVIDLSSPLTQKCEEDSWRAAAGESTHELVKWGKPITLCDDELWHESESSVWVFLSRTCLHVVFTTGLTVQSVCQWTERIWSLWFGFGVGAQMSIKTSHNLVWEQWNSKLPSWLLWLLICQH